MRKFNRYDFAVIAAVILAANLGRVDLATYFLALTIFFRVGDRRTDRLCRDCADRMDHARG